MGKIAVVTGASTGIGYELSNLLARDGYELFLAARNAEKLASVAREMKQAGSPSATAVAIDLGRREGPKQLLDALGGTVPDVLINNAGFGMRGMFSEIDLETQLDIIQVNVVALVELTRRVLPGMLARRSGRIMNIASTAAFQPVPLLTVYAATKSFVLHFSEGIAEETRGSGVGVTALCPGATNTEFQVRANMAEAKLFKSGGVMTASEVAKIGYEAMMKGKVLSVAGLKNFLGMEGLRLAPRSLVRKMAYKLQQD